MNIDDSDIKEFFVYGSCANYFYNKKSDIDVCIVIDTDSVAAKNPGMNVLHNFKLYFYNWAITHRCRIYGRGLINILRDKIVELESHGFILK